MDFNSNDFRDQLEAILFKIRTGFIQVTKLLVYGLLCGTLVGLVASIFALGIDYATALRGQYPWVIFLMPIGAAVIVFFYQNSTTAREPTPSSSRSREMRASPAPWRR